MKRFVIAGILIGLIAPTLLVGGFVGGRVTANVSGEGRRFAVSAKAEGDWHDVTSKTSFTPIARVTALCVHYVERGSGRYPLIGDRILCRDAYTPVSGTDEERTLGDRVRGAQIRACWESATVGDPLPECWR